MAYVVAFDTNDINLLKKAFSCYRIEKGICYNSMITARKYVLEDIAQIITSGFMADKVKHEMCELYSFQRYLQECCDEWVAYRDEPEKCKRFQRKFEDMCHRLRVDVDVVQSYYDNLFAVKRRHDEQRRQEAKSVSEAKCNSKKPRKTTKADILAQEQMEKEFADAARELAEAIECCSRWKHLIVLNPDLYDDEGDCMQSFLEHCGNTDNGHVFAIVSDADCWSVSDECEWEKRSE